ncbi:MAG: TraU family protein [Opitutaceae bacterium]|nr:TraU family protein [Opitutaceae bacterium]
MKALLFAIVAFACLAADTASATCSGRFPNPITDICWRCMFPLRLGNTIIWGRGQHDNDSSKDSKFVCACGMSWVGISTGYWEPSHLIDVSADPYCTPSLGGKVLSDFGLPADAEGTNSPQRGVTGHSYTSLHYITYRFPVLELLQVLSDNPCVDRSPFDILDFSAVNPGWVDEQIGALLNPDAFLYGTIEALMTGVPVGVCSTTETEDEACLALRRLAHWSVGFNGMTYPLSGTSAGRDSTIAVTMNIAKRAFTVQHRTMRVWGTSGKKGLCGYYPQPFLDDTDYKLSMLYPLPQATPTLNGKCCQTFGGSTLAWGAGRTWPVKGEDFSYLVFKKRDCCLAGGKLAK